MSIDINSKLMYGLPYRSIVKNLREEDGHLMNDVYTQQECSDALKAGYDLGVKLNTVFACFCLNKYAEGGYELYKVVSDKAKAEEWYAAEPYKHWYEEMGVE